MMRLRLLLACCIALLASCHQMGMSPLEAATQTITDPWVDGETPTATKWNSHETTFLAGINNVESAQLVDGTIVNADINASAAIVASKLDLTPIAQATTWDDGTTDAPTLTLQDGTDETVTLIKKDSGYLEVTTPAADGVEIVAGNFVVGDGTPGTSLDGEDMYVEGTFEVDGNSNFGGTATVNNLTVNGTLSVSGITLPTGAIFFMITGSCPSGTTDVSATYSDKFIRVNATQGTTTSSDSHTHTGPSHTHTGPSHAHQMTRTGWTPAATQEGYLGVSSAGIGNTASADNDQNTASGGTGATGSGGTGTSGSTSHVPASVTAKLCQVD